MKGLAETEATYFVDAGDALFKSAYLGPTQQEKLKQVATAIISAYNTMGCEVMNIGSKDLAAGYDFIMSLDQQAQFPFISANAMQKGSSDLMFPAYQVIETHDQTLGFVGVTIGDRRLKEFEFSDPVEAAQNTINEIREQVDLVFLMANVDDKTEKMLIEKVEGVDFILRSKSPSLQRNPKQIDGKTVIRIGKQGKYAGVLRIRNVDDVSQMKNVSSQYSRIKFADNRLNAMRKGLEEGVSLEAHFADDENRLKLISRLKKEKESNESLIRKLKNSYFLEPIALNEKIPDTPEVAEIVKAYMPEETTKVKKKS